MLRLPRLLLLVLPMMVALPAWAERLDLHYGVNEVDINGDGVGDVIVKARDNYGRGFPGDNYIVMIHRPERGRDYFNVAREADSEPNTIETSGSKGCWDEGYKFELDKEKNLLLTRYYITGIGADDHDYDCPRKTASSVRVMTYHLIEDKPVVDQFTSPPPFEQPQFFLKRTGVYDTKEKYTSVNGFLK